MAAAAGSGAGRGKGKASAQGTGRPSIVPGLKIVSDSKGVPDQDGAAHDEWELTQDKGTSIVTTAVSAVTTPVGDGERKFSAAEIFKMFGGGSGLGGNKNKKQIYRMRIVLANQTTSAAATANAPVYAIEPTGSSEMTALAGLFSEFRVKPIVHFMYNIGWSGAPNQQMAVVAYDPVNGTPLGSVSFGLQSSQCQLIGFGPAYTFPSAVTVDGYRHFRVKLLSGVITNGSVPGLAAADQWLPLNSSGGKFGYISMYVPNGPGGVTSTVQSYMMVDIEFRNRV